MNTREERGIVIAAMCKLTQQDGQWLVPSQSGDKKYVVDPRQATCSCPDHQETGFKCKHLYAVEFTVKRELTADGTVTETKSITFTEKKVYKQDWPAYNLAQSIEKDRLQELLAMLCNGIREPERNRCGRKPHLIRDAVFASVFKVYCTMSARRFSSDLREAHKRGYLSVEVPGMKTTKFMEDASLTPILKMLLVESARPLRAVERDFAIDSSGFGTCRSETWFDAKYGVTRRRGLWIKAHIASGVRTNVVTAVRILDKPVLRSSQSAPITTVMDRPSRL